MAIKRVHPSALAVSLTGSILIGFFAFVSVANADVSDVQREACTPDAFRLCSSAIPDAGKVRTCMLENKANLSERCRAAFQDAPAPKLPSEAVHMAPIEPAKKGPLDADRKVATSTPKASPRVASSARHQVKTHHIVKTARVYRSGGGGLYGGNIMNFMRRDRPIHADEAMGMARQMMITYRAACGSRSIPAEYCGF